MTGFGCDVHQNEYLPVGGEDVDAIVTVRSPAGMARATSAGPPAHVVVVIIDVSSSMTWVKLRSAKKAAIAAVEALADGTRFAVVAGSERAENVYPPEATVLASKETRRAARGAIGLVNAKGGTAMSSWLAKASDLFAPHDGAIRQAILLTDGRNEGEYVHDLEAAVDRCVGRFQCDCRGIGVEWSVDELRMIAGRLLGTVDVLADPGQMVEDFCSIVRRTQARHTADVRLTIATAPGVEVRSFQQVAPSIEDLLVSADARDGRTLDVRTGAWGAEERDYHLALRVSPHPPGDTMLVARVAVVVDGQPDAGGQVRAVWTDDVATATVIEPRVAHYTGQLELASSISLGLAARTEGDDELALRHFQRAVQLAEESGHVATSQLLARMVETDRTGTVRLRPSVGTLDEMMLDTRSTTTVRLNT
jgi:hypothetical protein